jgi:DNA polymerase I-like protein with 3'-5' exonuclease and polymerase domains
MSVPDVQPLVDFIIERYRIAKRRAAGNPWPWSIDPELAKYRFTNINVQDDYISRVIYEKITLPFAGHPGLIVALTACRHSNEPGVIEIIRECFFPSLDAGQYVARMSDRAARGLFLERDAYMIPAPRGCKGELKALSLTRCLFVPLANNAEALAPRPGEPCAASFERLRAYAGLKKGFITAQVIRDLKQVEPLLSAPDWKSFVWSGPGSRQYVDIAYGLSPVEAAAREKARSNSWNDHKERGWRDRFWKIVSLAEPQVAAEGIKIADAASWQNTFCEATKLLKYRSGLLFGARQYYPPGTQAPPPKRKAKPVPALAQVVALLTPPTSDWQVPTELPDLRQADIIALDTETKDDRLQAEKGSGWPTADGHIIGVSVAWREGGNLHGRYFPIRHPDTANFDPSRIFQWLRDLVASNVRIVTQSGLYDWGWLRAEAGIEMPPAERLEEISALATIIDENRWSYSLANLCAWRGLPGKDETLLNQAAPTFGIEPKKARGALWRMPARFVGPYAEADGTSTLTLFENLFPVLEREGTRAAYRLEVDLLPMVLEMRRRGVRVDVAAAERAREHLLQKRDAAFAELSEKLGANVSIEETGRDKWLMSTFDRHGITYPVTEKGNPSFKAEWMQVHPHWLPQLVARADKYHDGAEKFLGTFILEHVVNGRIHAEIHPHRSDEGGTRSLRFSYSDPPLQQMISHDEELAPLVRGVFLPEEGETWASSDVSQQEFRLLVHYAVMRNLPGAKAAAERYQNDPTTDFHVFTAELVNIDRRLAKTINFTTMYGGGVRLIAARIGKPEDETRAILDRYHHELPFIRRLSTECEKLAEWQGYIPLYDGARRHWSDWVAPARWGKGTASPCSREEAERRVNDPAHPWHRQWLKRVDCHKAMNALIQGSAARHTKLWMRACWCEGIVPLLQMHDALECSVATPEQAERIAQLGCEAVSLNVPMRIDVSFGRNWGAAKHTWVELETATDTPEEGVPQVTAPTNDAPAAICGASFIRTEPECTVAPGFDPGAPRDDQVADTPEAAPIDDSAGTLTLTATVPRVTIVRNGNGASSTQGGNGTDKHPRGDAAVYIYFNERGEPHLKVIRTKTKKFPQAFHVNGVWVSKKPDGWVHLPYRLPELNAAAPTVPVWIPEGEKDCLNLVALGLLATCNPEGAGKWQPELAQWFKGKQIVIVLEDNDAAGRAHAIKVATALHGVVADIRIVKFPELPEHGDVSDWLAAGHTLEELIARAQAAPKFEKPTLALNSARASSYELAAVQWIWPDRFAVGKLGLITGLPDEGKGQILCDIAARITRGLPWPCGEGQAPQGNVILLTAEDDIEDTVAPRLVAAGADLKRIEIVRMVCEGEGARMFSLVTDLALLRQKIVDVGDVRVVQIDPISAYLGVKKMDSYRTSDVRAVLGPLVQLAGELRVAIVGIMHFNKKTDVTNVLLRISDSLAFGATSRHVYAVVNDPEHGRKLFVKGKNNLAPAEQKALAYSFGTRQVGADANTGELIWAPRIIWAPEHVDVTATEAMQAVAESKAPAARDMAKEFLQDMLASGPMAATYIEEAAKANGIARRTLFRAKAELNIRAEKDGPVKDGERTWQWHPPSWRSD